MQLDPQSKEDLEFKDGPPAFAFKVGVEFPIESLKDFNKLARKKLEIEYSSSDGTKKQKIDIKNTPTVTPKKPGDTAFFPKTARSGHEFSITPKNGFKDGEWFVYIVDKDGKEVVDSKGNKIKVDKLVNARAVVNQVTQLKTTEVIGQVRYTNFNSQQFK